LCLLVGLKCNEVMKVLMYSYSFGSLTTTFIRNEVFYFSKKHDLVYLCQKKENDFPAVNVRILPFKENYFKSKLKWLLWKYDMACNFKSKPYATLLNEFIAEQKPDIIHCHFAYEALMLLQNIDSQFNIPIIVHFHGYDASQMLNKKSYLKELRFFINTHHIEPIIVSKNIKKILAHCDLDMSNSHVLYCGIDLTKFKQADKHQTASNKVIFIQNASLVEKKGQEYTLKAFHLFFKNNSEYRNKIEIIFSGIGEQMEFLLGLVNKLKMLDCVKFIGSVNQEGLTKLLSTAHAFIHHSITAGNGDKEGIPTAIMEAMAMELPVLSTFHAGIPELVQHGINGLLCHEKDVETYAKHILEIIAWKRLPVNRKVIEERFNLSKHNEQLESLYKQLMEKRN
jgi:colanic acid/amylovoran biosynthesis glycosyltransferase